MDEGDVVPNEVYVSTQLNSPEQRVRKYYPSLDFHKFKIINILLALHDFTK